MSSKPLCENIKCAICPKHFNRLLKKRRGRGTLNIYNCRPMNCLTCSPKCSHILSHDYRKVVYGNNGKSIFIKLNHKPKEEIL